MVTKKWSAAGKLKDARNAHAVIHTGKDFIVVGGYSASARSNWRTLPVKNEVCILNEKTFTCEESEAITAFPYPEVFFVEPDFGSQC